MRVLITQSAQDIAASSAALRSRGHEVLAVPLVTAERAPPPKINLAGAQGFLVTSTEGARALAEHVGVRTFPVFADSTVTAAALRALGFKNIETAKDDAADLARLVERRLTPANGALIYACSTTAPVNLPTMLGNMGFAVRPLPFYTIKRVTQIPPALREALENRSVDAALFLSPDEARAFVALVQRENLEPLVRSLITVAATPVVAAPLRALKLGGVSVPATSDLDAAFDALNEKLIDRVEEQRAERERRAKEEAEAAAEKERIARAKAEAERAAQEQAAREAAARTAAEQERAAQEKREREARAQAERDRIAQERAEKERLAKEKTDRERQERERRAAEKAEQERIAREKAAADKAEKERLAGEKAERERLERERRAAERAEQDRIAREKATADKAEKERLAQERAERERLEREHRAAEKAEKARIAAEQAAQQKAEREHIAREQAEKDRIERERLVAERTEQDRIAREKAAAEKAERERLAQEQAEKDRIERERLAAERAEQERITREQIALARTEQERFALERAAQERAERERIAAEKAEEARIAREKAAAEKAERERMAEEQAERDRQARAQAEIDRIERERIAAARAEQDRAAREKATAENAARERLAREQAEKDRIERERLAAEQAARDRAEGERLKAEKEDRDRLAREQAAAEKAERARLAAEQAERERVERERLAHERAAREQAAREAARQAKAERQRIKDAQAAQAKIEKDRLAAEKAADKAERRRRAQEEKERAAAERAQRQPPEPLGVRLKSWFARRNAAPETGVAAIWQMLPAAEATPERTETPTIAVAQTAPSATMAPSVAAPPPIIEVPPEPIPERVSVTRGPQPKEEAHVSENLPHTGSGADSETGGEAKSTPRGGGRAARLQAEDAADQRAKDQRFKYLGHSDAPPPEPEVTQSAPHADRGSPGRAIALFIVLALIVVGVFASASWWIPRVTHFAQRPAATLAAPADTATPVEADINALKARVAALEQAASHNVAPDALSAAKQELSQRLAALEARLGEQSGDAVTSLGDSLGSQAKQLTAVSARLATLEAAIGNSARLEDLSKRLNMLEGRSAEAHSVLALSDRVTALETTARRTMVEQSSNIALLMAVSQWRDALTAGRPFALELQTVKALAARASEHPDDMSIDDVGFADAAGRGLPTLGDLQRQFGPAAAAAMRASAMPDGTSAWYRRILDRVLSIITVRRLDGDAAGTSTSAVLARAQQRLNESDLAAAVNEMNGLVGGAATAAEPWVGQAKMRVAAERAAADLSTKAVAAMAATGKATDKAAAPAASSNGQ